ncbi:CARDB domain-containing protein [Aquimarina sp. M1]
MNYKQVLYYLFFLIISSTTSFSQNHNDYFDITINVDVNVNSGEIEINQSDILDLKVLAWGIITINVYGKYEESLQIPPTKKNIVLFIHPNFIQTTLTPIIIPPTRPDPGTRTQSTIRNEATVLLGSFYLDLVHYNELVPRDHLFTLRVEENANNTIVDEKEFNVDIYDSNSLADLEITNAEVLESNLGGIRDGVIIKSYIENIGEKDVIKKSKLNFYSNKENDYKLLGSIILEPVGKGERKSVSLFFSDNTYQKIVNDYVFIVADSENEIFERDEYNNTFRYYVPELQSANTNIKAYPNPFEDMVNFTFFMSKKSHPIVVLTIYDRNGNFCSKQGYWRSPDNSAKTISYANDVLPPGRYIYGLLVNNIQFYGTILKKE